MATEIERKFLLKDDSWKAMADEGNHYRQGYFSRPDKASIRVRLSANKAYLNIKSAELGIRRLEYEYEIPVADASEMLERLCVTPLIEKTRYLIKYAEHIWEVDVFEGDNAGLVVAEIELSSEDEDFQRPPWLGEEVSEDPRYYNVCLVKHPFRDW